MKYFLSVLFLLATVGNLFAVRPTIPAPPSSLAVTTSATMLRNVLTWQDNSSNEQGFKIYRATTSAGPWVQIGFTAQNIRTYYDAAGLSAKTTYCYWVRSYNNRGSSVPSNVSCATTIDLTSNPPATPVTLTNGVALADSVSGSTAYNAWKYYYLDLPTNVNNLTVKVTALTGDVDLYVRYNALPDMSSFNCKSVLYGTNPETCSLASPTSGRWYFGVLNVAVGTFTYNVTVTYTLNTSTNCTFTLSQGSATMTDAGGTTNVTIMTGCRWGMGTLPSWVTASVPSTYLAGNGTTTITFTVATNTDSADRNTWIYFYDPFNPNPSVAWSSYFKIYQVGSGCAIELWPSSESRFISAAGGLGQIGIQTSILTTFTQTNADAFTISGGGICPVVAFSDSAWLALNGATNGQTPMELTYIAEANPTNGARSAYIDVDGEIFAIHQSPYETNAPSTPVGLASTALSSTALYLYWTASTDDDRVSFYRIFKDSVAIETTPTAYITLTGLMEGVTNCYQVQAVDVNGNLSVLSTNRCAAQLLSSQRLLPIGFPASPPSFAGYRPARELIGKVNISFLRARFQNLITNSLVREYYEDRWLDLTTTTSAAAAWRNQSYGQVSLRGDIFDYFTLPINTTTNGQQIVAAAVDYLLTTGVDLRRYDGYVMDVSIDTLPYIVPSLTLDAKSFWTIPVWQGYPGEYPALSKNGLSIRDNDGVRYTHQFGHWHNLNEGNGIVSTNGNIISTNDVPQSYFYDNPYDPMGGGDPANPARFQFSSPEKDKCGWIKPQIVASDGAYTLGPYHLGSSTNKALKIPCGNQAGFWWVEYRTPEIVLCYDNTTTHGSAVYLNCHPTTNGSSFSQALTNVFAGGGLAVGSNFTDSWNGTVITATSTNSTSAVVTITLGTGDSTAPTIAITSPTTGTSFQGAIPIYFTATDDKLVTAFELYEDGLLRGRYHHPTCGSQTNVHVPFVACETNISTWVYYRPSTLGSHVVTMKVSDTVNSATSAVTITATADVTPTREVFASPTNNQTVGTNQLVLISYLTAPDLDIAMMRLYVDNVLVGFSHVGFVVYADSFDAGNHNLASRTWYLLDSRFAFDDATAYAHGDVDQNGNPKAPPHRLLWNTVGETEGEHVLSLQVEDFSGNVLTRTITVTVPTTL